MLCDYLHETGFLLKCDCDDCKKRATPDQRTFKGKDMGDIFLDILKSGWSIPKLDRFIGARDYISFINELGRVRGLFSGPLHNDTTVIELLPLKCYAPGHAPSETDDADESICETAPSTREELLLDKWRKAALEAHKQLTAVLLMTRVGELAFAPSVSKETADKVRGMWADAIATTTSLIFEDAKAREILDLSHAIFLANVAFDKINE